MEQIIYEGLKKWVISSSRKNRLNSQPVYIEI
jgi:hypothetical protein